MTTEINFKEIIPKFDAILKRGLCLGLGDQDGQMCIESAICVAMNLPFGDAPNCVDPIIRKFKICINDKNWSSSEARAKALRKIGIAQIGSNGIVDGKVFIQKLSIKLIQILIPTLFEEVLQWNQKCLNSVKLCREDPTIKNCFAAAKAAVGAKAAAGGAAAKAAVGAINAAYAAAYAAGAFAASTAADYAASAGAFAAYAAGAFAAGASADKYLIMCVELALEVLYELESPGCKWINFQYESKI